MSLHTPYSSAEAPLRREIVDLGHMLGEFIESLAGARELEHVTHLTINGIAAGLRTTG